METKEVENLKSFDEEDVPDLGQKYWMQKGRIESNKGLGLPKMLGISIALGVLTYHLIPLLIWTESLMGQTGGLIEVVHDISFVILLLGTVVAGFATLGTFAVGIGIACSQRRWNRELVPCPDNYSPEMAEKAFHAGVKIDVYNTILKQTRDSINSLHTMKVDIEDGLDFVQNYRDAMSEDDIDELTLHSEEGSVSC